MSGLAFSLRSDRPHGGFRESEGAAYLANEDLFLAKFRHWRGRSGRSYVFSAYPPGECPAYEDAVLLVTSPGGALSCTDLGALPEARLGEVRRLYRDRLDAVEFQIHVLANRPAERRALIADLTPDPAA